MNSARNLERQTSLSKQHLSVLRKFLTEDEFKSVRDYHYALSIALGTPVGFINLLYKEQNCVSNEQSECCISE